MRWLSWTPGAGCMPAMSAGRRSLAGRLRVRAAERSSAGSRPSDGTPAVQSDTLEAGLGGPPPSGGWGQRPLAGAITRLCCSAPSQTRWGCCTLLLKSWGRVGRRSPPGDPIFTDPPLHRAREAPGFAPRGLAHIAPRRQVRAQGRNRPGWTGLRRRSGAIGGSPPQPNPPQRGAEGSPLEPNPPQQRLQG